jgi:cell division protein FtsI (penicillin-binding protein 3)
MPETQATRRLQWLLWLLLAWVAVIGGRLVWLQIFEHDDLLRQAQSQQQRTVEIQAERGAILDRTGQPLAKSLLADSVCVNPRRIPDAGVAADLLSRVLDLDGKKLRERLEAAVERKSGFLWIKRKISDGESARLRSMNLDWVEYRQELRRFYPHGTLASHVVGSTGVVDDLERGNAGIEMAFDELLSGRPGLAHVYTDVKQNPYDSVVVRKPEPGANLTLTIDPNLQYIAEKELDRAVASSGAVSGSIVAVNPSNGEVLAMANYPRFDPNVAPGPNEKEAARSNIAISTPFEPGSVFKVVTLSTALETTNLTPDSIINCGNGSIRLFGRVIHDDHHYSMLSMADVLAKSSNIGAIQIGLRVGERELHDHVRKFGFGRKSGIELPGESAGSLRRLKDWTPSSIGSISMGHEVSTTSIQLALLGAAVANGGLLMKPKLVLSRQRPGGPVEPYATDAPERIMRPETAIKMRAMMEGVVLRGTGRGKANLRGYTSGGKTGSAQIYDPKTHSYTHNYNASFLGFAPVTNPQIVIAVTLNHTTGGTAGYGGPVAAPVFREIATQALRMMDVPKDLPEVTLAKDKATSPSGNDLSIANPGDAPAGAPLGQRSVSSVTPPPVQPGAPASPGASALDRRPFFSPVGGEEGNNLVASAGAGPRVPDFRGMTLRAVLEESAAMGLEVRVAGSGLARSQTPPPGAVLLARTPIRVQFGK